MFMLLNKIFVVFQMLEAKKENRVPQCRVGHLCRSLEDRHRISDYGTVTVSYHGYRLVICMYFFNTVDSCLYFKTSFTFNNILKPSKFLLKKATNDLLKWKTAFQFLKLEHHF